MSNQDNLTIVPVSFRQAKQFVAEWHRHHKPPVGHKFSVGVANSDGVLVGVAMVGRPVARHYDDGLTLEVNRTATDGSKNANSALYGAAWRAAKALGYCRLITYTQEGESGVSLKASGWKDIARRPAHNGWDRPSRKRQDDANTVGTQRVLWEAV